MEEPTPLRCGCSIPWPTVILLGSGGKVQCDLHGWQHVTKKEKTRAETLARKARKCSNTLYPTMTEEPPF
jgi:hypothetical protein